jgi:hypothetical protein
MHLRRAMRCPTRGYSRDWEGYAQYAETPLLDRFSGFGSALPLSPDFIVGLSNSLVILAGLSTCLRPQLFRSKIRQSSSIHRVPQARREFHRRRSEGFRGSWVRDRQQVSPGFVCERRRARESWDRERQGNIQDRKLFCHPSTTRWALPLAVIDEVCCVERTGEMRTDHPGYFDTRPSYAQKINT